jgi:hypothetical protein
VLVLNWVAAESTLAAVALVLLLSPGLVTVKLIGWPNFGAAIVVSTLAVGALAYFIDTGQRGKAVCLAVGFVLSLPLLFVLNATNLAGAVMAGP